MNKWECHHKGCEQIKADGFCYRSDCLHFKIEHEKRLINPVGYKKTPTESGRVKTSRTEKGDNNGKN